MSCPAARMRYCGRTSMTASYVMICLSCLCGIATHGAHGSSSKSKTARVPTATFPATGISTQDISLCGGYRTVSSPYVRMKFEQHGLGFQNLYNIPQGVEVPWLTYQQFSNLVGNVTDMVIAEQSWQPMIDAIWENRTVEDYETTSSTVKTDFMRKWHHNRSGKSISLDEMMENEDGDIFEVADPRGEFEQKVISEMQIAAFAEQSITEKDREILKLRMDSLTEQEIADKVGYKTASAVHKRIAKIAGAYEDYVTAEYGKYLDR